MSASVHAYVVNLLHDLSQADTGLVLLVVILVAAMIVLDAVTLAIRKQQAAVGLNKPTATVSVDGSKTLPVRHYVSEMQALAGKPDALISEDSFIIPIERKPLARKIRDRYVAQLLVYMRLVEEFEGKKPPYGYLLLGPNCRRFKIENSPERQAWLQRMLDEMRGILAGQRARPDPHPKKCARCDVRAHCKAAAPMPHGTKELGTKELGPKEIGTRENDRDDE